MAITSISQVCAIAELDHSYDCYDPTAVAPQLPSPSQELTLPVSDLSELPVLLSINV